MLLHLDLVTLAKLSSRCQVDLNAPNAVLAVVPPNCERGNVDVVLLPKQLRSLLEIQVLHLTQLVRAYQPLFLLLAQFARVSSS